MTALRQFTELLDTTVVRDPLTLAANTSVGIEEIRFFFNLVSFQDSTPSSPIPAPVLHSVYFTNPRQTREVLISRYILRMKMYSNAEPLIFVFTVIYIRRLALRGIPVTRFTLHRLVLSCFLLSWKFYSDSFKNNKYIAGLGGIKLRELNFLEVETLRLLQFHLCVEPEEYQTAVGFLRDLPSQQPCFIPAVAL